jgi:hypothetical protein
VGGGDRPDQPGAFAQARRPVGGSGAGRLPYLTAQRDAQTQFDGAQFAGAAKLYLQAVAADPFASGAAFQGVNSYLLNDQVDEAVAMLKTVRVRGTSAAVVKADAMLKELSSIHPPAAEELRAGVREPPALTEVLSTFPFGVPDAEAGKRYLQRHPVDLTRPAGELATMYPPPPPPARWSPSPIRLLRPTSSPPLRCFRICIWRLFRARIPATSKFAAMRPTRSIRLPPRVTSGVRVKVSTEPPGADLSVEGDPGQVCQSPCFLTLASTRQVVRARMAGFVAASREIPAGSTAPDVQIELQPEYGFVQFNGLTDTVSVLVNGKQANRGASGRLQLPVGKYQVQLVEKGKVLSRGDLEITALSTIAMPGPGCPMRPLHAPLLLLGLLFGACLMSAAQWTDRAELRPRAGHPFRSHRVQTLGSPRAMESQVPGVAAAPGASRVVSGRIFLARGHGAHARRP